MTEHANAGRGAQAITIGGGKWVFRYLIGATGYGASLLHRQPYDPFPLFFPLSGLIFSYKHHDIQGWLLASEGKNPLTVLVLEASFGHDHYGDVKPTPVFGLYPCFNQKPCDRYGQIDDIGEEDFLDDESHHDNTGISIDEEENGDEGTLWKAPPPNRTHGDIIDL